MVNESRTESTQVFMIEANDDQVNDDNQHINPDQKCQLTALMKEFYQSSNDFLRNALIFVVKPSFLLNGVLGIAMTVGIAAVTLVYTCWPQHNVILRPEYWYEPILPLTITLTLWKSAFFVIDTRTLLKDQDLFPLHYFWHYYFIRMVGDVLTFLLIYYVWVKYLYLPHPMPRTLAVFSLINTFVITPLSIWLIFPSTMKTKDNPHRNKIFSLIFLNWFRILMTVVYGFVPGLPFVTQEHLQLSLGLLFPLMETFNMWWNSRFTKWAFNCDEETIAIENIIFVQCSHSFSLTIVLGNSKINRSATVILILVDTLVNGWSARNIIKYHQQGTEHANALRDRSIKSLALKEYLEILIPIVYCLSFIGSYIGSNYEIIGGIGSDIWQYEQVSSLYEKLEEIAIFMIAEFLRGVAFAVALWKFYGLNMFSAYCDVIRKNGILIFTVCAYANISVNGCYLLEFKTL